MHELNSLQLGVACIVYRTPSFRSTSSILTLGSRIPIAYKSIIREFALSFVNHSIFSIIFAEPFALLARKSILFSFRYFDG